MKIKLNQVVEIKTHKLGGAMIHKRGTMSVRAAAQQAQVNHSTWHHVEQGQAPSMEFFRRIMEWLEIPAAKWAEYMDFKTR